MIISQCPGCQASFRLKDEFGEKNARCPNCSTVFPVPAENIVRSPDAGPFESSESGLPTSSKTDDAGGMPTHSGAFSKHVYGIKQKRVSLLAEKYYVRDENNVDLLFAVRKLKVFKSILAGLAAVIVYLGIMGVF